MKRRSIRSKKRFKGIYLLAPLLAVFVLGAMVWLQIRPQKDSNAARLIPTLQVKAANTPTAPEPVPKGTFKKFTNDEFVKFYSSFAYPNTSDITIPPATTGNGEADKQIQKIAEQRGYRLRSAPNSPPISIGDGIYLQQKALQPLIDLKAAAKAAGHILTVTAAFRSIEEQKALLIPYIITGNSTAENIARGESNSLITEALKRVAPPGYSRHHTGFTIDLACGSVGGEAFLTTGCYKWLSDNNFLHAKEFGWIPSYPEGSASVGPEPEPWEFVWVGREALLE